MGSEGSGGRGSPIPCHTLCRVTDDKPETDSPLFNFMYSTLATCRVQPAEGHLLCAPCVPSLGTGPVHPVCEPGFAGGCGVGTRVEGWRLSLRGHIVREESPPCHSSPRLSHTSKNADVVLLCGDLNMHPKDLGCCLLKEWTGLRDAFIETEDFKVSGCFPPTPTLLQSSHLHPSYLFP